MILLESILSFSRSRLLLDLYLVVYYVEVLTVVIDSMFILAFNRSIHKR